MLALSCVVAFAWIGKGAPARFDPTRRLVVRGPYRFLRNPMYIGAAMALAGAARFYESPALFAFVAGFLIVTHMFVVFYGADPAADVRTAIRGTQGKSAQVDAGEVGAAC